VSKKCKVYVIECIVLSMVYVSPPVVVVGLENPSFGVRGRFLAEAQVMSPAIFVSEASVFLGLATEKKSHPEDKESYP
jgi:hypothetical protein